jgi:hypothetical protein
MQLMSKHDVDELQQALDLDGYVVLRNVVSKERLDGLADDLAREFERVSSSGELFEGGGLVSGHLNCFPGEGSRFVYDDLEAAGAFELAKAFDPVRALSPRVTLNYNLPGSAPQFYHVDDLYTEAFLIYNIAVVDTDLRNGAIDVLPGTNRQFYRFWQYALQRKYRSTTRVCMQQGDVLVRISTLWHRGMPNLTDVPRPMMSITFGEKSAPAGDPFLVNDGRIVFTPNWFSTSRLGQLRERAFVKAPWTYSSYRFARSLYSDRGYSHW